MTSTTISRRSLVKGAAAGAATIAVTGSLAAAAPARQEAITLTFLRHVHEPANELETRLIEQYQTENPGITIEYVLVEDAELFTRFSALTVAGTPPDIINLGSSSFAAVVARDQFAPIDLEAVGVASLEELEGRYIPNALSGYIYDGTLYGLPSELSNYVMWANTQMLETAGLEAPPATWEELAEVGPQLVLRSDDAVTQEAIALPFNFPGAQFLLLDAVARQAGGSLFSDDGTEAFLTSEPVMRAVQMFADLVQTSQITDPALSGTTAGADRDLFLNGVTAMMLTGGSWFRGSLNASDVGEFAIPTPYPRFEDGADVSGDLYGYGLGVLAASEHPAEAWRFVAFLGSHGLDYFTNGGLFIGDVATAESEEAAANPDWSVFQEELAKGYYHPRLVNYNEIGDIVGRAFDAVVRAGQDPTTEFEAAQSRVSSLLNT